MDLEEKVKEILVEKFLPDLKDRTEIKSSSDINSNTSLYGSTKGLNLSSLDYVEFILDIEERYEISIPNGTAQDFKTFGEVVQYLRKQLPEDYDQNH